MAYRSTSRYLRNSASIIVYLLISQSAAAQETQFLGTIELGDSKREVQTDTATALTVVDQEEINDRQAGTIAELIDSVPGVSLVNGSTPQGSGINIRGYGANGTYGTDQKVAVQVDGASVGSEELYRIGTQLFSDPALFRSVEVVRGTVGSFAYGSGIVGGVVSLETKDASDFTGGETGTAIRQTFEFGTNGNGAASSTILAWQPTDKLEFLANYTYRQQDNQTDGAGDVIGASAFGLPTWMVKARYSFGQKNDQSVTFSYTDTTVADRDVPYDTFGTTGGSFGNVDRDTVSGTSSLQYAYNPFESEMIDLTVTLSYAAQQIDQTYIPGSSTCEDSSCLRPGDTFPAGGFETVNASHRYETAKLNVSNTSLFSTDVVDHNLLVGIELTRKTRLNADSAPGGTDERAALFVVNEMTIGDAWTITPALRYETSTVVGSTAPNDATYDNDALMGGLSVRYAFNNGVAVFGSAAYTEGLPIIDDLGDLVFMTQSEKSQTFELGVSDDGFDVFKDGDSFAVKANIYQTELWDITSYSGRNKVESQGIELETSYTLENGFYVDANANFVTGKEFRPDGTSFDWGNTPADSLRFTVGKKFGKEFDISWETTANREISVEAAGVRGGAPSTTTTPGFFSHNLRATYIPQQGVLEGAEFRFGAENIFDADYRTNLSTRNAPGRNVKFTIAKTF